METKLFHFYNSAFQSTTTVEIVNRPCQQIPHLPRDWYAQYPRTYREAFRPNQRSSAAAPTVPHDEPPNNENAGFSELECPPWFSLRKKQLRFKKEKKKKNKAEGKKEIRERGGGGGEGG